MKFCFGICLLAAVAASMAQPLIKAWEWQPTFTSGIKPEPGDFKVDSSGNTYAVSSDGTEVQVNKISPTGSLLWTRLFESSGRSCSAKSLVIAPSGNVYVAGSARSSAGRTSGLMRGWRPDGSVACARLFNSAASGNDAFFGVSVTSDGKVMCGGVAQTTAGVNSAIAVQLSASGVPEQTWFGGEGFGVFVIGHNGQKYLMSLSPPLTTLIQKMNADGTFTWTADLRMRGLSDFVSVGDVLYFAGSDAGGSPGCIVALRGSDGVILQRSLGSSAVWRGGGSYTPRFLYSLSLNPSGSLVTIANTFNSSPAPTYDYVYDIDPRFLIPIRTTLHGPVDSQYNALKVDEYGRIFVAASHFVSFSEYGSWAVHNADLSFNFFREEASTLGPTGHFTAFRKVQLAPNHRVIFSSDTGASIVSFDKGVDCVTDGFTALKNTMYTGNLASNDHYLDASGSYTLYSGPSHGTAVVRPDGTFDYTPATNFVGSDLFYYRKDRLGAVSYGLAKCGVYSPRTPSSISVPKFIGSGQTKTCTLFLSSNAGVGGVTVTLSSSNTAVLTTPASTVVPSGTNFKKFSVAGQPVTSNTGVYVRGTVGTATTSSYMVVTPVSITSISGPTTFADLTNQTYTIHLSRAAPTAGTVQLWSDDINCVVPATVSITPGAVSTTATVRFNRPLTANESHNVLYRFAGEDFVSTFTVTP